MRITFGATIRYPVGAEPCRLSFLEDSQLFVLFTNIRAYLRLEAVVEVEG